MLPAGAFAGWDSHPLESAALSRRTSEADIEPLTEPNPVSRARALGARLHKCMLEVEGIDHISDEMRAVVESEWPELAHKLPPKAPQG